MKSYNWKKGIFYLIVCAVIGAVGGRLLVEITEDQIFYHLASTLKALAPSLFVVACILGIIGLGGYFYFNAKLKKEHYVDEEGSFYEVHEKTMSITLMCSTLCAVVNFTALGLNLGQMTSVWVLFIVNVVLTFIGEVAYISLNKKVRPELNADPLDKKFKKNYFEQLDEYEKNKIGKVCFDTLTAMVPVYIGLFLVCYVLTLVLDISSIICLPIGIMWALQTILMTYYSNKTPKA